MNTQKLTLYETWDDLEVTPMPHSRLYSLEPLGVGTAQVESLTSYLARLALAHQVSVSSLLLGEIAPAFRRPKTKSAFFRTLNYSLLRANDLNKELIWILQRLTGRLELPYLSILPWAEIIVCPSFWVWPPQKQCATIAPGAVGVWRNNAARARWSMNPCGGVFNQSPFAPGTIRLYRPGVPIVLKNSTLG